MNKRTGEKKPPTCHPDDMAHLGYLQWHDEADRRREKGIKPQRCPTCKLYYSVLPKKRGSE